MLKDQEWELLEQLYPLLDVSCLFYIVSFLIVIVDVSLCHKKSVKKINANIYHIPFMDRLNDALENFAADANLFPAVHMAVNEVALS
jgi:hypothetical protein